MAGGALSCGYSAGALLALVRHCGLSFPHVIVASSGSAGAATYKTAGQDNFIEYFWGHSLSKKQFISLRRFWKIMDIDYLVDEIFKKQAPLDVEKLKASPTKLFISVTNYKTGKPHFFSNQDEVDIFEVLRASKAAPLLYNKTVTINGVEYVDGALGAPIAVNIKKAFEEGATDVIAIDNIIAYTLGTRALLKLYSMFVSSNLADTIKNYSKSKERRESNQNPRVLLLQPSIALPAGALQNNEESMCTTMAIGFADVVSNPQLNSFLKEKDNESWSFGTFLPPKDLGKD